MFFDENAGKRMQEAHQKTEEIKKSKQTNPLPLRFGKYCDGATILDGDPPLVTVKKEPGEVFMKGTLSRFDRKRGWILLKDIP